MILAEQVKSQHFDYVNDDNVLDVLFTIAALMQAVKMDEICSQLFAGNWTKEVTPMVPTSAEAKRRIRRFIDDDGGRCVSLISLFLAVHDDSKPSPTTTATTTDSNVTETPALSSVALISDMLGQSVLFGLLPTMAVIGIIVNSLVVSVIARDSRCELSWRVLRCFAVIVDIVLLILYMLVVDVAALFGITSLEVLNTLASLVGLVQYIQPWILYIIATYVHQLLLDERHKVPPQRRVRSPRVQVIAMIVAGGLYFSFYMPPIRLLLYRTVAGYQTLCTVPLFDQWQLSVGQTASTDLFYYLFYDCFYTFVVYLAPIVPLSYRYRRLVDAIFRRDYQSVVVSSRTSAAALGSWADVLSVTCGVHIVTHCTKSTLLTMRLTEAISVDKYLANGEVVFQLMNSFANVTLVFRSICHLSVMVIYDPPVRSAALRKWRAVHAAVRATVRPYVRCDDQSEDSSNSIELDSIVADDDALDNDNDVEKAVPV